MKSAGVIMLTVLAGCAGRQPQKPWTEPAAWKPGAQAVHKEPLYPDDNEDMLTQAQKEKLREVRLRWRPVELTTPYDADPAQRALYLDWYGKGYTYFEATGLQIIPNCYNQPATEEQRVKYAGWRAGELAARLKEMHRWFSEHFHVGQNGAADGSQPMRTETNSIPGAAGSRR